MNGIPLFEQGDARAILRRHCRRADVSIQTLDALVEAELEQTGKKHRAKLWDKFDDLLGNSAPEDAPGKDD
jgi:hypothetical protein